jgi:hypothetical protein
MRRRLECGGGHAAGCAKTQEYSPRLDVFLYILIYMYRYGCVASTCMSMILVSAVRGRPAASAIAVEDKTTRCGKVTADYMHTGKFFAGAGSSIAPGSLVCIRRDDGTDATLLRRRPTVSRAADAFVTPKLVITAADRLMFLKMDIAEGASFALVRTDFGVEGYVHLSYITPVSSPAPGHSAPISSSTAAPCKFFASGGCAKGSACKFAHVPPAPAARVHSSKSGAFSSGVPAKEKGGSGVGFPKASGGASSDSLSPFHFVVEWVERLSVGGSSYYNTRTFAAQQHRPDCFPSYAPLVQRGPEALRSKSILHPAFLPESPSLSPPAAARFIDPEEPVSFAVAASANPPSPSPLTFTDFFASLQKFRSQLGGSRCADKVPEMKRYTGMHMFVAHTAFFFCIC